MIIINFEYSDWVMSTIRVVNIFTIFTNVKSSRTIMFSEIFRNRLVGGDAFKFPSIFVKFNYIDFAGKFSNNVEIVAIFWENNMATAKSSFIFVLS